MLPPLMIGKHADTPLNLLPALANRHGLITGATGTGKTVTLQKMAESFSQIGVPVFVADVKGDLSGIAASGTLSEKLAKRLADLKIDDWHPAACPTVFWDVFAKDGHPIRATISDLGPLLLGRLLELNDTQSGVLELIFKIADDNGLLLLDMKDLRAMVLFVGENSQQFTLKYGNIATSSIGAIQRGLLSLEQQGAANFFGEPMLDIADLMQTNAQGAGIINLLVADKLYQSPKLYAVFLLWLLSELFEKLPEVGDLEKPKIVFFFDEAHLLFNDAPPALINKVEQVVRLIRSKGVGVYFVSQSPLDIPETILGQLGNRVQHALRAFTVKDQKAVKAAADTMRANPDFNAQEAIMQLGVGEALISFLDSKGIPSMVERGYIIAPCSRMGALTESERQEIMANSPFKGKYDLTVDRLSAYEKLNSDTAEKSPAQAEKGSDLMNYLHDVLLGSTGPKGGRKDGIVQSMGRQLGREIIRGVLGSILGKRR